MMKILAIILFSTSLSMTGFAADSSSGCGLGWKVVQDNSLVSSYTRSITNSLTSNTVGMTSGTSGCAKHSIVKKDEDAAKYTITNFDTLKSQMASGEGEALAGLARIMGCSDSGIAQFSGAVKSKYRQILPSPYTQPTQMFFNLKKAVGNKTCAI